MRKQDRIRQQQDRPEDQMNPNPQPREQDQLKGSGSEQPAKPPRQPGKLPLPD
jgi:hypothetical protein